MTGGRNRRNGWNWHRFRSERWPQIREAVPTGPGAAAAAPSCPSTRPRRRQRPLRAGHRAAPPVRACPGAAPRGGSRVSDAASGALRCRDHPCAPRPLGAWGGRRSSYAWADGLAPGVRGEPSALSEANGGTSQAAGPGEPRAGPARPPGQGLACRTARIAVRGGEFESRGPEGVWMSGEPHCMVLSVPQAPIPGD
jgi:hypothetical protein